MRILLIDNNPLRVLGVFANASLREIEQNKAQLRAYAHVGQRVLLPLWLNGLPLLSPLSDVTEEQLAKAQAELTLSADRDRYSLFWFERDCNHVQDEQEAIKLLNNYCIEDVCRLWRKRTDHAAQKNLLLLAVLTDDWLEIATKATQYFDGNLTGFRQFMNEVIKSSPEANNPQSHELLFYFPEEMWSSEMKHILVNRHKLALEEAIDRLKHTGTTDALLLRKEIDRMVNEISRVEALRNLLGNDSFTSSYYSNEAARPLIDAIHAYTKLVNSKSALVWAAEVMNEVLRYINVNDLDRYELWSVLYLINNKPPKIEFGSNGCVNGLFDIWCKVGVGFFVLLGLARACQTCERKVSSYEYNSHSYKPKIERYDPTPGYVIPSKTYPFVPPTKASDPIRIIDEDGDGYIMIQGKRISIDSIRKEIFKLPSQKVVLQKPPIQNRLQDDTINTIMPDSLASSLPIDQEIATDLPVEQMDTTEVTDTTTNEHEQY
ncbi:MAG: hypothetical protein J6W52_04420 [Bacteroidaceae bacterium]|nr:hypothetical protein [Bacteroidaceae bacterium]